MKINTTTTMKNLLHLAIIALVALIAVPASASAATVYLEASRNTIAVGDTAVVAVKINSDAAVINTVEGDVALKSAAGNLTVQEFSLANSSFGLWPRTPSLSTDGHTISYVGGVPGGFSIEGATLFKIVVQATKEGVITISPQNTSVFANDGKGTKLPVQFKNISITVTAKKTTVPVTNDWAGTVSGDTIPPGAFIIVLGQDASLFSGKKFAYFSAVDNQSGIDHYEVSENNSTAVRSGSTYVLQDQSGDVKLNVVAFDKAGNKTVSTYPVASDRGISWLTIIIVVLAIVIVWFLYKKWKRGSTKASTNAPTHL